jgi:hypothetical protein
MKAKRGILATAMAICSAAVLVLALAASRPASGSDSELSPFEPEADDLDTVEYDPTAVVETTADGTTIFYEVAPQAAAGGAACHGDYITAPSGTTVNNWVLQVAPRAMGSTEPGSEKDNALLYFYAHAAVISPYTWQIRARSKYRFWSSRDGVWQNRCVNYALIRR